MVFPAPKKRPQPPKTTVQVGESLFLRRSRARRVLPCRQRIHLRRIRISRRRRPAIRRSRHRHRLAAPARTPEPAVDRAITPTTLGRRRLDAPCRRLRLPTAACRRLRAGTADVHVGWVRVGDRMARVDRAPIGRTAATTRHLRPRRAVAGIDRALWRACPRRAVTRVDRPTLPRKSTTAGKTSRPTRDRRLWPCPRW